MAGVVAVTDADLRDQALVSLANSWAHLDKTTKGATSQKRQQDGTFTSSTSEWRKAQDDYRSAVALLGQIPNDPPPPPANEDGNVGFCLYTGSQTDYWTNNPTPTQQQLARDVWDEAIVYDNYWTPRLSWYPHPWAYYDVMAIYTTSQIVTQHPEWILRDAAGKKLTFYSDVQYAADIGNPAYRSYRIDRFKELVALGYGLFFDDVNMDRPGMSGTPINPRTGSAYLNIEWGGDMADYMVEARAALPTTEIVHNSLWWQTGPDADRAMKACDVFCLERGWCDPNYSSVSIASLFVFCDKFHAYGVRALHLASGANTAAMAETNLAGALIASNGTDLEWANFGWQPDALWWGHSLDLGAALGPRSYTNGTYSRGFLGGTAYLRDPGATPVTVAPGVTIKGGEGRVVLA